MYLTNGLTKTLLTSVHFLNSKVITFVFSLVQRAINIKNSFYANKS